MCSKKIVVAITGSSGSIYANDLLKKIQIIRNQFDELCVVMSDNAKAVWQHELENKDYEKINFQIFDINNFYAPFASGSGKFDTMIIIPCSMGTVGRIANGISTDLIGRAADVILKERRKLICVVRETPYNLIHLNNLKTVSEAGGIICPATPSFYSKPKTIEELIGTVTDRVLDICNFDIKTYRWAHIKL